MEGWVLLMAVGNRKGKSDDQDRYFKLVQQFPLRPIRSDVELDAAVAVMDELLDRSVLTPQESDYLEVLSDLVERYEAETHPMEPVSDAALLQHLIEAKNVSQVEVARETRVAESTISEVLAGRRTLNRRHIGSLARYFGVQPSVFAF